jgi:LacI family transcriptional regulator
VLIADSRGSVAQQTEAISRLIERGVDGMIIVPRRGTRIADIGCPVAVVDTPSTPGNTVAADHWDGGRQIARHLQDLGHRKIVLIGNNPASNVQNDRIGGLKSALDGSVRTEVLWIEKLEEKGGAGCALGLAEKVEQGFTAFAAVSDLPALRVLTELQQAGINVPERASVTGFDDLIWSSVVTPGLTTMRMNMIAIAEIAVSALVQAIEKGGSDEVLTDATARRSHVVTASVSSVPMELIVRHSSGPPLPAKTNSSDGEPRP